MEDQAINRIRDGLELERMLVDSSYPAEVVAHVDALFAEDSERHMSAREWMMLAVTTWVNQGGEEWVFQISSLGSLA